MNLFRKITKIILPSILIGAAGTYGLISTYEPLVHTTVNGNTSLKIDRLGAQIGADDIASVITITEIGGFTETPTASAVQNRIADVNDMPVGF
jgi:hypothetical protein